MSSGIIKPSRLHMNPLSGPTAEVVREGFTPGLVKKPHIDTMLGDAYIVIHRELAALRKKVMDGDTLSESESRKMGNLTSQLVKLAAEEREQAKQDKLDEMSDKELVDEAKAAIGIIGVK